MEAKTRDDGASPSGYAITVRDKGAFRRVDHLSASGGPYRPGTGGRLGGRVEMDDLPVISADPVQMRQLFQNLIENGLKFQRVDKKPVIKVSTVKVDQDNVRIMVEDNGIGFDEVYLNKIFSPFQRLNGRNDYEGTGMGLAICKKIVERHGGSISAQSLPGQGSKFMVILPNQSEMAYQ